MSRFFNVRPPREALDLLLRHVTHRVGSETVPTSAGLGRVLFRAVSSGEDLPPHARSSMDGYSVRSADTFGATETMPAYLEVVGEVPMGAAPAVQLRTGEAAGAYTGGLLAHGADAVLMIEHTERVDGNTIEALRPVAPGENVIQPGEDIRAGEVAIEQGGVLRPQDVGSLLALGVTEIEVAMRPTVAIVSTGDELVEPSDTPGPGQIRDINTYTIGALVSRAGGVPAPLDLIPDDLAAQTEAAHKAMEKADAIVFSAGSSVSSRDLTAQVLDGLGEPGVLAHGISHKPGKPTILAATGGKPAFGLPGNPVSAMTVFEMLVRPTIYRLCGCESPPARPTAYAVLTRDVPSVTGREDHVQVRIREEDGEQVAEPLFGKSNLIYTLTRADGSVTVPADLGGLYAGERVSVSLY